MNADERGRIIADRKEQTDRKVRLWCKDTKDFAVFRVPVEALLLNADNRRFAAERQLHEEKLRHSLTRRTTQTTSSPSFPYCLTQTNRWTDRE